MSAPRILLTGAGSAIGYGLLKSLRAAQAGYHLVAADTNPESIGFLFTPHHYVVPPVKDPAYWPAILRICEQEKIGFVLVGSTVELPFYSTQKKQLEKESGLQILCNTAAVVEIGNDKLLTQEFLRDHGLPYIHTTNQLDSLSLNLFLKQHPFPLFAKPRHGKGSQGLLKIERREQLQEQSLEDYVLQEYLPGEEGEYTVGLLSGRQGEILSCIILKRELKYGMTFRAERVEHAGIEAYCRAVAAALPSFGPLNFQLRLRQGQPFLFEINPRFSSSSYLRTLLGMNEPHTLVHYLAHGEILQPAYPSSRIAVRGFEDYLLPA